MIKISKTDNYQKLVPFFVENGLEFEPEAANKPTPKSIVQCWEVTDNDKTVGGFVLAKREGEFICDGIAVDPAYRRNKMARSLLLMGIEEMLKQGGTRMYLVARTPAFFKSQGFETVAREDAPEFFECLTCPQYGVDCHPEVMLKDFAKPFLVEER